LRQAQVDPDADPARHAARRELGDQVHGALGDLSPLHRDVVVLHELHGLTYHECAEILGVPVGTVKSRLSNAFRRLRDRLGAYVLAGAGGPAFASDLGSALPAGAAIASRSAAAAAASSSADASSLGELR
jgi:hypothetical protein